MLASVLIVVFILKSFHVIQADGVLVGAFVMPHGGIALDPRYFNTTNATAKAQAWLVHDASKEVGKQIEDLKPDTIVLSTPHGIAAPEDFIFYLSPRGFGYSDTDNCACPPCCYNLSVVMDTKGSETLVRMLKEENENVSYLSAFGPPGNEDVPFPLRWGEVVPLYFTKGVLGLPSTKAIILSQPSRRYTESVKMIPELRHLGESLFGILHSQLEKIVVIISADLAHTHLKSGPYGFSTAAEPFDKACGAWVSTQDSEKLVAEAASYVDKALSCGFTGLVMLDGMLKAGPFAWKSRLLANYHPSYYGMMLASFVPQQ
ncbi:uncharacterized protein LOC111323834 [Stylophora pistillata]|uniref:Protein TTE1956 n=1 Tax=Stylophora pistillata TaxID=50429 RepID=A0A2B4SHU6_STYPI|nr:uncharacterized protein LOC111323834 [Stylophora pistillata]PFX30234.1 Protein TTE1956 [Stylophora pistillata]